MNIVRLNQSSSSKQTAEVGVPGAGRLSVPGTPIHYIEKIGDQITLYMWGDVAQEEPTHVINRRLTEGAIAV